MGNVEKEEPRESGCGLKHYVIADSPCWNH